MILQDKVARSLTYRDALAHGLGVMRKTEAAGYAAFGRWISMVSAEIVDPALYAYHKAILFNYAELHAWGSDFLNDAGCTKEGSVFMRIHNLCWKADAAAKGEDAFSVYENRCKVSEILREIVRLDHEAEGMIEEFLRKTDE